MSLDNLGNEQTIVLHNCEINNEKYDLIITPHKQTIGYVFEQNDKQIRGKYKANKDKLHTKKRFSKRRNQYFKRTLQAKRLRKKITKLMINYVFFFTQNEHPSINTRRTKIKKDIQKQTKTSIQLESTNKTH